MIDNKEQQNKKLQFSFMNIMYNWLYVLTGFAIGVFIKQLDWLLFLGSIAVLLILFINDGRIYKNE